MADKKVRTVAQGSEKPVDKTGLVFAAYNNHVEECGKPPNLSNQKNRDYFGYFENRYGEQFVFRYDRSRKVGAVCGGDCDWGNSFAVHEFDLETMLDNLAKQPTLSGKPFDREASKASLLGNHVIPSSHRLPNGNFLYAVGTLLGTEEMYWLKSCWYAALDMRPADAVADGSTAGAAGPPA